MGRTWYRIFATTAVDANGVGGLLRRNLEQHWIQAAAIVVSAAVTWGIFKVVDATVGLRVHEEDEVLGRDTTQHG